MGDLSIDKPFNKAVSSNVVIEHDSGLVQLTSVFDFNLSGVLTHVSLTSKKMFPNEKNNIEGTLVIGDRAFPSTITVSPKLCGDEGCWDQFEITASNLNGETFTVLISGH